MFIFYFIIIIINKFEFDDLKYCVLISVLRFTCIGFRFGFGSPNGANQFNLASIYNWEKR